MSNMEHMGRGRHSQSVKTNPRQEFIEWVVALAVAVVVGLVLHFLVFQLIRVDGPSMQPTLHTGQRMFSTPATYMLREPVRGEIIITSFPNRKGDYFVKRVIALPGERVAIYDGSVYINGERLNESYIKEEIGYTMDEITVEEGHVFVLGDNRNDSTDSHDPRIGTLPYSMLKGKVQAVIWPLTEIQWVSTPEYNNLPQ